ncbi:MAG: Mrp/NBP35 family ATP-binding protein [Acidimicrobiia bacterium]|jgi:ATP-binding protein involved in chromosome partitioning
MVRVDDVYAALRGVVDPELGGDIVELGMVTRVDVRADGTVEVGIALTIAECPMRSQIEGDTLRKVRALPGVTDAVVRTTAMTRSQRADLMSVARRRARENAAPSRISPTTRVVAVASGKGGVGKSSVSANLAVALADRDLRVGLLDADIWGFSIPRMLGTADRLVADDASRLIIPAVAHGIRVVSTGLIIDSEETALMWRGLMLSKALEQFLTQVDWGELDYLVIDMPPGTGDIQMALSRLLPQAEMVVVTTPQLAAQKVAVRVADMARRSYMPLVGVVENMAGFDCGHGTVFNLFGEGGGDRLAEELSVPLIGRIPVDPEVVAGGDSGVPVVRSRPDTPAALAFHETVARLVELLPPAQDETCTGRIAKLLEGLEAMEPAGT